VLSLFAHRREHAVKLKRRDPWYQPPQKAVVSDLAMTVYHLDCLCVWASKFVILPLIPMPVHTHTHNVILASASVEA
jgi:hypothetical protein